MIGSGSFICLSCWLVAVDEGVEQDCSLNESPSKCCTGDGLGDECYCFHGSGWLVIVKACSQEVHIHARKLNLF